MWGPRRALRAFPAAETCWYVFPCALGRAQRGLGNFLGPCSSPEPPELGQGEPGAQVGLFRFSPNQSPGVSSQEEADSSPGHREEHGGDTVSPWQEQEGEWVSLWEEWDGECDTLEGTGKHREVGSG